MRVAVDVGGTFTDVVFWDGAALHTAKVSTTPDQSDGLVSGVDAVGAAGVELVHGTTAATNAVLQRKGARTAFVTDAGFEDLVEIGRQDRPSLYDTAVTRPEPLITGAMRFGVPGRATARSAGENPDLAAMIAALVESAPEAVAVSLLFGFAHPEREQTVAAAIRQALHGVPVSLSSEVAAEIREYERASTTILNAYLAPVVERYLLRLAARVQATTTVMRSSGGLIPLAQAASLPASIVLSGPAGGAVAAAALARALGLATVVSFDMGGTSTDVCRIERGRPEVAYQRSIDGLPSTMPSVAIHTVGAGGGSIGWVDPGGALRVGPASAGADPGPACYRRGGSVPTVTDADLVSGRIGPDLALGGTVMPDVGAAGGALGRLSELVGGSVDSVALGMIEVVEAHMERAVRRVSVEEGADPRDAVLVAFGGAGGLHATALARRLGMAGVVIPAHSGVFSALGLLLAPPRIDVARSVLLDGLRGLGAAVAAAMSEARAAIGGGEIAAHVDLRYRGQSHETTVAYHPGEGEHLLIERFHAAHRRRNGFDRPGDPVEAVTVRAEAILPAALRWEDLPPPTPSGDARRGSRPVLTASGVVETAVWRRRGLRPGDEVAGPAVIEEDEATTFLGPGERARVHESGALEVAW
ncbi:MAG: hydantoinase/oxoprolinase family protein [Acidimicrobiia bacterium]|nr:hydantoinase/oxoprolinase family protein [Acidimicrobiia bacterium]